MYNVHVHVHVLMNVLVHVHTTLLNSIVNLQVLVYNVHVHILNGIVNLQCHYGWEKVRIFEPLFIRDPFEAKSLKLYYHAYVNVCTCALVQSKHVVNNVEMFQKD